MSRRLILRTTPKLFSITATYPAPRCLLPLISHSNAVIPRGHVRNRSTMRRPVQSKSKITTYGQQDRLNRDRFELSRNAYSVLKVIGMSRLQSDNLLGVIRVRTVETRGLPFVFDCLRNRETYLLNNTKIPKAYKRPWENSIKIDEGLGYDLANIGEHSDEVTGTACHAIGLDLLRTAQVDNDTDYMSLGCFLLELAVLYKKYYAAAQLINYYNDPVMAGMLVQARLQSSTREAEVLIRDLATKSPHKTPPGVMLVYLREEYSPRKIGLQNPKQLQWGFTISQFVDTTDEIMLDRAMPFDVYVHPAQIRLQIIEHCLSKNIPLPELSLEKMPQARNEALQELVKVNDPRASMILAVREDGPEVYSDEWERLLLAAAAGGFPEACHLISVHCMRKEGLLSTRSDSKAKMERSTGLEFGRICILAYLENGPRFVGITAAYAAICRAAGDYDRGLNLLKESLAMVKNDPNFPRRLVAQLEEEHIRDYELKDPNRVGYWSEEKCKRFFLAFDTERLIDAARKVYH